MKTRRSITLALTGLLTMLLATTGLGLATVPAQASPLCNNPVGGYTGAGTLADPYLVTDADQLCNIRDNLNAYYRQTANIDLSSYANWNPIGADNITPFTGTYDGNGWTVGNLAITSIADNQGLFGVNTGTITNANVAGIISDTGGNNIGLLAGTSTGTIAKSYATGSINADGFQIGGLIGTASGGTVTDSSTNITITGTANNVGGLIGLADGTTITRVYTTGTTNGTSTVGGLIGSINGSNGSTTTLTDAYSTGAVTAPDTAGGLTGLANARQTLIVAITTVNISNVYSQASVTGTTATGGLIGYISSDLANEAVSLTDAYSTGAVTGTTATGGLIGADNGNINHTITSTYWDTQTSGQATSDFGSPQTTVEMGNTATYIGWVFPPSLATWGVCPAYNSGYPFLWSMETTNQCGPEPVLTTMTPVSGPAGGGTTVTLKGVELAGATSVTFGGVAATINTTAPTSLNVTTAAHPSGIVDVAVTTPSGTVTPTGVFTYTATPAFTSVTPTTGSTLGGTDITITGADFLPTNLAVTIGGVAATNVVWVNGTTITATTPAGVVGAANIVVTDIAGTDTGIGAFTYITPPTVTSITPNNGDPAGGTDITIVGSDFATGATVTVGGNTASNVVFVNATTITATTPAHAAAVVDVTVTNLDGISGTGTGVFTYNPAPTVTDVSPASGTVSGGTSVTITGTGFLTGAAIDFDTNAATSVVVVNPTTITATTPAHAAALVDVTLTNGDGQKATLTNGYTYTANPSAPSVTSITPTSGPDTGNNAATITGTAFVTGATVTFGGIAATDVFVLNPTTITVTTPAHAAGAVNVVVTNPDLQNATLAAGYTFTSTGGGPPPTPTPTPTPDPTPPPSSGGGGSGGSGGGGGSDGATAAITEMRPSSGPTTGGTTTLILGYGFWGATGATIGGTPVQSFKWIDAATIEIVTPPGIEGWQEVRVTMPNGSVPAAFKYVPPTNTPPTVTTTQIAAPPVTLPRKVKFNKWTRLIRGPVTTNANQKAALGVIALTPTSKVSHKGYKLRTMKDGRVYIKVTRKHLTITVTLTAPAVTGYTGYLQTRTYRP